MSAHAVGVPRLMTLISAESGQAANQYAVRLYQRHGYTRKLPGIWDEPVGRMPFRQTS